MEEEKKSDGKGRPRKSFKLKKVKRISFALTDDEYFLVLEKCKKSNFNTISQFVSRIVISGEVKAALNDEEKKLLHTFIGLANNVNQLAFQANLGGVKSIEKELLDFVPILRKKVNELKK